mmetsp:Transcript_36521/g.53561  ORF Transcript_36521/g.53561 Transcript_36521/m.53561 type:complete len:140 (-) Transcript_36521:391-810(-)|eukprot:CAMPEP_0195521396 /NCGR_PEP_ID=MMETSP0794_2-20130614/18594_1 /TAXON_ID=515487 /ORGANISM="Stephanopyxis turris, Strain CCMP 815" /LENGTH=139 /DNA_ID=CAMNT_0040650941 /DNA_START=108 /DNA_END=527 /DNA_ORIENTATION=+
MAQSLTSSSSSENTNSISSKSSGSIPIIGWLIQPNPDINYNVISMMYAAGSLLALALYGIDYYLGKMMNAEDGNDAEKSKETSESTTISELYTSLEGVYLIFLPFVPCLCWSLMLRYLAERQKSTTSQQQKEEEMKKNK